MSEFDTHDSRPAQDPVTRLKFERYVFFAFFAVMVMVVIAGILELRKSQNALEETRFESQSREQAAELARARAEKTRQEADADIEAARRRTAGSEEREARRARELAATLTQLALFEADAGPAARARGRQLLDEAARLGAPPYIDLARWALADTARAGLQPIERTPFICAATSPDGRLLAIGRGERGIDILEIASGRKLTTLANPEAAGEATALAFAPGALMCGYRGGQIAKAALSFESPASRVTECAKMSGAIKLISVSALGRQLAVADALENVRAGTTESPERALLAFSAREPLLDVLATDSPEKPVVTLGPSGRVVRMLLDGSEEPLAAGGSGEIGSRSKGVLGLVGTSVAWAWYAPKSRLLCGDLLGVSVNLYDVDEPSCLTIAIDGTLLVGDKAGRVHELSSFNDDLSRGTAMGSESALRFVARAGNFVVGIAADGTVAQRLDLDCAQNGRRVLRSDGYTAVSTHGFANTQRGLVWSTVASAWLSTGPSTRSFATPLGYAAFSEGLARLDSGASARAEFMICALSSGTALLRSVTGDVFVLGRDGTPTPLPQLSRLAPDFVCAAAASDVVLARSSNSALVIRLENGVAVREIFAQGMPMLGAIDEHGQRVALPDRDCIRILTLEGSREVQAFPRAELKALAFLFDGSILCALEGKELAFYDSASGRELLRRPTAANTLSGAGDRLFLVCPDELRELRLR